MNSLLLIEHILPSIRSHCNQKGQAFIYKQFNLLQIGIKSLRLQDACHGSSNSVFVLALPLGFVIVDVAGVQRVKHLPHSCLQAGCKELDILLHAQVQNLINALCEVHLNIWPQSHLSKEGGGGALRLEEVVTNNGCFTSDV